MSQPDNHQPDHLGSFTQPTPATVSERIRRLRKSKGLTLHDFERLSGGAIKAVVMGSYERGTRAISLARTIEIANLFGIPVTELISETERVDTNLEMNLVFDLRKISAMAQREDAPENRTLNRFLSAISVRRRDWNGEVLSLRKSDFDTLTLLLDKPGTELIRDWADQKLLIRAPNHL